MSANEEPVTAEPVATEHVTYKRFGCYDTGISTCPAITPMPCALCYRRSLGLPESIWYEKGGR